jgi:two-component system, sensor histidine kinase PdtaS
MKKQLLFLFFIFFSISVFGQLIYFDKKKTDSLFVVLKDIPNDISRINISQEIFDQIYSKSDINNSDLFQLDSINRIIFELSKKRNYKTGIGYHYMNYADIASEKDSPDMALIIHYSLKAQQLFLNEKNDYFYFRAILHLNETFMYLNRSDEAKKNILKSLQSKNLDDNLRVAFYEQMSRMCYRENSLYEALFYLKKGLSYNKTNKKNKRLLLQIYDLLFKINLKFSRFSQANYYMDLYYQLVKEDPIELHCYYMNKSDILQEEGKYEQALKLNLKNDIYFKKLDLYKTNPSYKLNKFMLAKNYRFLKQYDMAIMQYEDLLKQDQLNPHEKVIAWSALSIIYNTVGEHDKANLYINKALANSQEVADPMRKATVFKNKAIIAKSSHDYVTALKYSDKSAELVKAYYEKRQKNDALSSLNNMEDSEKEDRIKQLKIAALEKTVQIDRQKNYLILILLGLGVAVISILVYWKLYASIKKRNKIIEIRNQELLVSQNIIQKALQEKELLVKEIHHRVKNNLQLVMSLLSMQLRHNKEINISDFVKTSQSRISSIALLYEQLYQQKSEGAVNFKEYITVLSNAIVATYSDLQHQVSLNIEVPAVYFDLETATPLGLIISEFINNSFKHAFPNGQKGVISLKLTPLEGKYELNISDNGVGLAEGYLNKNTLGIQLVNLLVSQIKGVISIKNRGGTNYCIQF